MTLYKRGIGKTGEELAANFLKENGFKILELNFRTRFGEIDIIAQEDNKIHFVEVKTRTSLIKGQPHEAVTFYKLQHFKKAAQFYLLQKDFKGYRLSLDVISILLDSDHKVKIIKHFKGVGV